MGCASRRRAVPVATLLLLIANAGAGPELNPAAAIAAAAGHPAHLHLRAEASRTRSGQTESITLDVAEGKRLNRVCLADLCSGTWFDGSRQFGFGLNGTPLPDDDSQNPAERTFAAIASTMFAEPDFRAAGGVVSELSAPHEATLRYRVIAPQGAELVAVADARTHRLTGIENPDQTLYRSLTATVAGSTVFYGTHAYDRIVVLNSPLEPPTGPRVSVPKPSQATVSSDLLPIVPCSLAGRTASCLIDSGTNPSALTLDFAERLGQEPHGQIEIAGLGTYLTGVVDAGPLVVAGATFEQLRFAVIPHARGAAFDAILGSDALAALRITFDPERHTVQVAATSEGPPEGRPIELQFAAGLPYAQVRLASADRSEAMLVDTGDSETLSIGYDRYREETGLFAVRGSATAAGLGGATMDTLQGQLAEAQIGALRLDGITISAVRGQHVGHLGYGLAARCRRFTLDLGLNRLACVPKAALGEPPPRDP